MRRGVEILREQGVRVRRAIEARMAEAEAVRAMSTPLSRISMKRWRRRQHGQSGVRSGTASIRGEILLKRDPTNTAPAEEEFITAIDIARGRKRAASNYARRSRWQALSINPPRRRSDAVLAPALEGFAPTPEIPEIEKRKRSSPRSGRLTK